MGRLARIWVHLQLPASTQLPAHADLQRALSWLGNLPPRLNNRGGFDKTKPHAISKLYIDKLIASSEHKKARLLSAGLLDF
jgi:hypothetical protein